MGIPWYERALGRAFSSVNRFVPWYSLPFPLAVLNLVGLRANLRLRNLHDTQPVWPNPPRHVGPEPRWNRSPDGSYNDLEVPAMGMAGTRFGRNVPLPETFGEAEPALMSPSPRLVARRLLAREEFVPASTLNVLAVAWLQFMVHDWFSHGPNDKEAPHLRVALPEGDDWFENPMTVLRTTHDPNRTAADQGRPDPFRNVETQWWDASQVYGSSPERLLELRRDPATGEPVPHGKLHLDPRGHLPLDPDGLELAGLNGNWWIGLSVMHTLFAREHNAICDRLRLEYPDRDDQWLFDKARLINAALLAKIHTVEWTPSLLDTPELRFGMRGNWWGVLGEAYARAHGRKGEGELLRGIIGSPTDHHAAPYSITEEFVAVYRMHPLLPDELEFRARADDVPLRKASLLEVQGVATHELYRQVPLEDVVYSLGTSHPGALVLHNYPRSLMALPKDSGRPIDMASIDVLRDRERGVPRYCRFRRLLGMMAPRSFEELTADPRWAQELREVYGDIERVDLLPGTLAERKPPGFAFGDTVFRIFILMASRRLKSDRFFTAHFTEEVYTRVGLDWIAANGMRSVLERHFPTLAPQLHAVRNAFFPWPTAPAARVEVPGTAVDVLGEGIVALSQREGGRVHAFLLDDGDGLTLVDTLFDDDGHRVLAAIAALGRSPGDLRRIVLTHAHRSHLGGLAALQAKSGAKVHAHPWEADIIAGLRKAQGVGFVPGRPVRAYPLQLGLTLGLKPHRPVPVEVPIGPGDRVGPLRVVDASGHTPGHLAFHWPERDLLIAGDAIATWPHLDAGWPKFNLNAAAHRATMARLAALEPRVVGVGHGDPIKVATAATLKDLAAKAT